MQNDSFSDFAASSATQKTLKDCIPLQIEAFIVHSTYQQSSTVQYCLSQAALGHVSLTLNSESH
jgi:hypothetical protein